jgi:hypothetical protein
LWSRQGTGQECRAHGGGAYKFSAIHFTHHGMKINSGELISA